MPHFTIYQGEAGLRSENMRMKAEIDRLKAENERLRQVVGEPALVQAIAAEVQAQRLAPAGQVFTSGDCQVTIGPATKAPVMNPTIARARAPKAAAPVAATAGAPPAVVAPKVVPALVQPIDLPASTQEATAGQEVEVDAPSQRFQLIEIR